MEAKTKEWIRRETLDTLKYTPEKFNEIYYYFNQLIFYSIDVPALAGLEERLSLSLSKITTQKLDRDDIVTFFPIESIKR